MKQPNAATLHPCFTHPQTRPWSERYQLFTTSLASHFLSVFFPLSSHSSLPANLHRGSCFLCAVSCVVFRWHQSSRKELSGFTRGIFHSNNLMRRYCGSKYCDKDWKPSVHSSLIREGTAIFFFPQQFLIVVAVTTSKDVSAYRKSLQKLKHHRLLKEITVTSRW